MNIIDAKNININMSEKVLKDHKDTIIKQNKFLGMFSKLEFTNKSTCSKVGISTYRLGTWKMDDYIYTLNDIGFIDTIVFIKAGKTFSQCYDICMVAVKTLMEEQLIAKGLSGDIKAIKYYLDNKEKHTYNTRLDNFSTTDQKEKTSIQVMVDALKEEKKKEVS